VVLLDTDSSVVAGHDRVLQGIDKAIELGYVPKVNVVVTKGVNDQEVKETGRD
jgi:molybdenum cofactor biosynthesis enzyme MoaA